MSEAPDVKPQPLVYIIVLNYRMGEQVIECLRSLLQLSYSNYRIIVVDNGSGDGIESAVKSEFSTVTVIQTGANLGYTGGNNAGIEYALGNGVDYVLVVNPDTVTVNAKFVDEMVSYLESHPEVGIAGPRVFLREMGNVQNTVLFAPGLWRSVTNWFRFRIAPQSLEFSGGEVVEAEVLNGVCLLIRTGCLRQIGLFDENIFMYIEDADMDYRARQQGWRVKYLPIDSVIHRQKREGYHMTGLAGFLLKRNSVYYLCKIGKSPEAWGYAIFSLALLFARAVLTLNKKKFGAYLQFIERLAAAYRVILFNRKLDETFGPPFDRLKMKTLQIGLLLLLMLLATTTKQAQVSVVEGIRGEATRKNTSSVGRPLPLVGHWNMGQAKDGFSPDYQMRMIEQGHYLLPWFLMPNPNANPEDPRWIAYYEGSIKRAAEMRLPIALVGTQWESLLSVNDEYLYLPPDGNPNVAMADGKIRREVSPFGPPQAWYEVGMRWGSSPMMRRLQELYPEPPLVLLISNNEHAKLQWTKVEDDRRFAKWFGRGLDDDSKRKVVGDGWIARYRTLEHGFRDGLANENWRANSLFVGYDAFGPAHFGRWAGWMEYSLYSQGRIDPWPLAWDGGSPSFYVFNWAAITDYTVFSPQVETMNWVFMQAEAWRLNPNFWFEMSVWDGHDSVPENDKRTAYARAGQRFTPERYGGMAQFGMWLLRPRTVREFRGWLDTLEQAESYFLPVVEAVDRVHHNPTLREFWRKGALVANRAGSHPYQTGVPVEYQNVDRWFLLDTSLDPKRPWELGTPLPVFSLALVMGSAPQRQWLIYAHAPLGERQAVRVTIPGFRAVTINVAVGGSFYLVDEKTRRARAVD